MHLLGKGNNKFTTGQNRCLLNGIYIYKFISMTESDSYIRLLKKC